MTYSQKEARLIADSMDRLHSDACPFPRVIDQPASHDRLFFFIAKRILDIAISLLVIVFILSWLLPILTILILVDSGAPVFFTQKRVGLNNRVFNCYKLRTIGEDRNGKKKCMTPLGRWLRYRKLDEIPQFLNVLSGEMSIVGPRPHMLSDHRLFSRLAGRKYFLRHCVRPGITGLAQVRGYEGPVTSLQKLNGRVRLDLLYIQKWSLGFEVKIIWLTFLYLLRKKY